MSGGGELHRWYGFIPRVNAVLDALLTVLVLAPMVAILAFTAWISYLVIVKGWRTNRIVIPPAAVEEPAADVQTPATPRRPANQASRPRSRRRR
jgi:hypothetical protein